LLQGINNFTSPSLGCQVVPRESKKEEVQKPRKEEKCKRRETGGREGKQKYYLKNCTENIGEQMLGPGKGENREAIRGRGASRFRSGVGQG